MRSSGSRGPQRRSDESRASPSKRVLHRLELAELLPHAACHREVALAFVAVERYLERRRGFIALATFGEDLGEVAPRGALPVEPVGPFDNRDGFTGKRLALDMQAATGEDPRLHRAPEHLRHEVFIVTEGAATLGERLRLGVAAKGAERASIGEYVERLLRRCVASSRSQ
jgi:hypothetical protein